MCGFSFLLCLVLFRRGFANYGFSFFYADQRLSDGAPMLNGVSGPAHGELYAQLVQHEGDIPWLVTFVQGKGYVKF